MNTKEPRKLAFREMLGLVKPVTAGANVMLAVFGLALFGVALFNGSEFGTIYFLITGITFALHALKKLDKVSRIWTVAGIAFAVFTVVFAMTQHQNVQW